MKNLYYNDAEKKFTKFRYAVYMYSIYDGILVGYSHTIDNAAKRLKDERYFVVDLFYYVFENDNCYNNLKNTPYWSDELEENHQEYLKIRKKLKIENDKYCQQFYGYNVLKNKQCIY